MLRDIERVLKQCEVCEKLAPSSTSQKSDIPLKDGAPFKKWALNIIGPMPPNSDNKRFIITAFDYFTWWPVAWMTKDYTGLTASKFIGSEIVAKFGKPDVLVTDDGTELKNEDMDVYLLKQSAEHIKTSSYNPQANGQIERLNGSII